MSSSETDAASEPSNPSDFEPRSIAVLSAVVIAIAAIPILIHPLPPLSDYINHLGRTYIISNIASDPNFARFYYVEWQVLPNLMIDLVLTVLNFFMSVYVAGQIFTIAAFILIVSGALALNRALFGSWSALPLIVAPLLYNGVLLVGVMNYVFGIGIALWALAVWVMMRERMWLWRLSIASLFAVAMFFCHLYVVGIYGLVLLAFELRRLWERRAEPLLPRLADFFACGIPFLIVLGLLLMSPTWDAAGDYYWMAAGKIDGLFLAVDVYYPPVAFALMACVFAAAGWAYWRGILHFHPLGWFLLPVGAIVYIAMPRELFAAYLADQRLPIALAYVLIACFRVDFENSLIRNATVGLILVLLIGRVVEIEYVWSQLGAVSEAFYRSVMLINRGARVLVVYGERSASAAISDLELVHAASLATIERSALVSTTFTVRGKQVLHVRNEFKRYVETEDRLPPAIPYFVQAAHSDVPYFFARWPQHFDYVYILFTKHEINPAPKDLNLLFDGPSFQLYRVIRPK